MRKPWKLWNGYGPLPRDRRLMAVERIGPEGGGGLVGAEGRDIIGTKEDLEAVVNSYNSFLDEEETP